jgi:hypothetical protein
MILKNIQFESGRARRVGFARPESFLWPFDGRSMGWRGRLQLLVYGGKFERRVGYKRKIGEIMLSSYVLRIL